MAVSMLNSEAKLVDVTNSNGNITAPIVNLVSAIAEGSDYNQRTGNSIKVENVRLDYFVSVNATATTNYLRVLCFRDFSNQGAPPNPADLLEDNTSTNAQIVSPLAHFVGDRFEVLYDHVEAVSTQGNPLVHRRVAFGISDHVLFNGTTNGSASAWQGSIWIYFFSDNATNGPLVVSKSRCYFVDN